VFSPQGDSLVILLDGIDHMSFVKADDKDSPKQLQESTSSDDDEDGN
jgi:hypothetical protein